MARSSNIDVRVRLRNARQFQREVAASGAALESMGLRGAKGLARFAGQSERLKAFGATMTRNVTLPILAGAAASVKMFMDFDDSMNKMVGLVGISREQVNAWHEDILDLSTQTGQAPQELADAMFFVTSAGLRGKAALDALTVSAKAADSGLGETKVIADAVTSAMNAYGERNLSAARATDILTAAVREGKLEASELAPVLGQVLPLAQAMGVSFDEVAGSIALFAKSGIAPAKGATQLTSVLSTFAKPTTEMKEALEQMGLTLGGVRQKIAKEGLLETISMLRTRTKQAGIDLSEVFGNKRAITGVLQLTKNLKGSRDVLQGVANSAGMSNRAFKEAQETAGDKFQDALNSLKVTAIRLGAALGPTLAPMLEEIGGAIASVGEAFSGMSPGMRKATLYAIGFVAAIGPAASILGYFAGGIGRTIVVVSKFVKFWSIFRTALMAGQGVIGSARIALLAFGISLKALTMATGIGLVITALILLEQKFHFLGPTVQWVSNAVRNAFNAIKTAVTTAVSFVVNFVKKNWKLILLALVSPVAAGTLLIIRNWDKIKAAASALASWVKGALGSMIGFIASMPGRISGAASGMWDGIKDAFKSAINWIIDRWNGLEFRVPEIDPPGPGPKFGGFTVGLPDIPRLAEGGNIRRGGATLVGEAGPEILNLPRAARVTPLDPRPLDMGAALRGLIVRNHNVLQIDGRTVAEVVADSVEYEAALGAGA